MSVNMDDIDTFNCVTFDIKIVVFVERVRDHQLLLNRLSRSRNEREGAHDLTWSHHSGNIVELVFSRLLVYKHHL